MNRLANEKSPYLLQHAGNPIDWYPWGPEAFDKASREHKPIFLSVGYSTCHWCHVMEEESFSRQDIADILNADFVSVKVDREERPDLDQAYMKAVMAMTGQGGWPLTVFLTPSRKAFHGGTYFPPESKWGRKGLKDTLLSVSQVWKEIPEEVQVTADLLAQRLQQLFEIQDNQTRQLDKNILERAYLILEKKFDSRHGGFGAAPKFPSMHQIYFLNRYEERTHDIFALEMTEKTLRGMAKGGIFDHLGGGFHRYATDEKWLVPHFEKMLYDQALVARGFLEAYQMTHEKDYVWMAGQIFEYVLRDLSSEQGGFYSAQDADSFDAVSRQKREGAFYVWTKEEIVNELGPEDAELVCYYFGVRDHGNAQDDPFGEFMGKNVLFIAHSPRETAQYFNKSLAEVLDVLAHAKERLYGLRMKRALPFLDDKILTDWNGLMISSLAYGAKVLSDDAYLKAAQKAADFILSHMLNGRGELLHRYRDGESAIPAMLDDYAFFIQGLLDLYETTFEARYLKLSRELCRQMIGLFEDRERGGFFMTRIDQDPEMRRSKEAADGAIPSGNAVAAMDILRLSRILKDRELESTGERAVHAFSGQILHEPENFFSMLLVLDFLLGPVKEFIFVAGQDLRPIQDMLKRFFSHFSPNAIAVYKPYGGKEAEDVQELLPYLREHKGLNHGKTTVYICENLICQKPMTDKNEFYEYLRKGGNGSLKS